MYAIPMQNRQALPPGWEAKYDPNSKRWFYLNHVTHTTQWTDPRLSVQQAPTMRPAFSQSATGTSFPTSGSVRPTETSFESTTFMEPDKNKVKILLKEYNIEELIAESVLRTSNNGLVAARVKLAELGYHKKAVVNVDESKMNVLIREFGIPADLASSVLRTHVNNLTSAESALVEMGYTKKVAPNSNHLSRLKVLYPAAPVRVIKEQLVLAGNNVQGTKLGLEALGYKKGGESPYKATPAKVAPSKPVFKKVEPKKLGITEKLEVMRKMKQKFPNLQEITINMCLTAAKYDLKVAEGILREQDEKNKKREVLSHSKKEAKREVLSHSKKEAEVERTVELAPKVFGGDSPEKKTLETSFNDSSISFMNTMKTMGSSTSTMGSFTSTMGAMATTMGAMATRTKNYVPTTKTTPLKQTYTTSSKLRTQPMGPNPALCKGHNPSLLITAYVSPMGPNVFNRKGPQVTNRCGSLPSNHKGPANMIGHTRRGITCL